jgi:hypothetical protein
VPASNGLLRTLMIAAIAVLPTLCLTHWCNVGALTSLWRIGLALSALGLTVVVYLAVHHLRGSRELGLLLSLPGNRWSPVRKAPVKP